MLPPVAPAQNTDSKAINDLLKQAESHAVLASDDSETLESYTRSHTMSWESHAHALNLMKDHVNDMGKMLADMEALKPQATLLQERAIASARPHLQEMANGVESAIAALNRTPRNLNSPKYRATLHGIWTSADRLYRTIDTIIDYHEARSRMSGLMQEPVTR